MDAVIDTVAMNHLLRPKHGSKRKILSRTVVPISALEGPLRNRQLFVWLDRDRAIVDEWMRTCNPEHVRSTLIYWEGLGALKTRLPWTSIKPRAEARRLHQLGFRDTIDKLLVRLALAIGGATIVSNDPDFWNPADAHSVGSANGPVAVILRNALGINLFALKDFVDFANHP